MAGGEATCMEYCIKQAPPIRVEAGLGRRRLGPTMHPASDTGLAPLRLETGGRSVSCRLFGVVSQARLPFPSAPPQDAFSFMARSATQPLPIRFHLIVRRLLVVGLLVSWSVSAGGPLCVAAAEEEERPAFIVSEAELVRRVFSLAEAYFADFRHPETHVLYGSRLSTKRNWTSPEEIKAGKPKPWGYGSRIADTVLHCGHLLVALLDAQEARPDPFLERNIKKTFAALQMIGSLPEVYPKPDKPALSGLVPRGPHPDDATAYYDDSSMDQHTTYIISLSRYANSSLASEADKAWIRESLQKVGRRLEKHQWSIKQADGVTQAHVGFAWTGFNSDHASILLPAVYALYLGTGDEHWREVYQRFLAEKDGLRWKRLHPGPHVRINGHPIYANQNAFRVHALFQMETDPKRKEVLRGLLQQSAEMQCKRDFPGPFYRRFHSDQEWSELKDQLGWQDDELHGCDEAWNAYRSDMLDRGGLAVLAHVRFPLGGFHMILLSEQPDVIRKRLGSIWKMLSSVDLKKISAGETNYLFTVVALHTYAFYFHHRDLFTMESQSRRSTLASGRLSPPENDRHHGENDDASPLKNQPNALPQENDDGKELALVRDAGIGPTMDLAIDGDNAFAIGRGKIHCLNISDPNNPRLVGELAGLGHVRQIAFDKQVAYVTSREDGLFIVDVKHPDKPKLLSHYDTIEFATGVAIAGDVLYVACRHYGVELIDVSDPARPLHLSTIRTGEAQSVVARGEWLYVGVWATSEVVVVNTGNPRRPRITARVQLDGFGDGVDVQGHYLYAATGHHSRSAVHRVPDDPGFGAGHGLELFDISDPGRPRFVSRVKFPRLYNIGNDMWSVTVAGRHAFVADTHNGIYLVDVQDAKHPRVVGHRKLPRAGAQKRPGFVGGLALTKDLIYVAGGATDLHVFAAPGIASTPAEKATQPPLIPPRRPAREAERFRSYRVDGQVHAVQCLDSRAVVACGAAGVHVVNLSSSIEHLSTFATSGFASDVGLSNETVLIAAGTDGLLICELAGNGELTLIGAYRVPGKSIKQLEVPLPGKFALLQVGANNLHIVDISNPAAPKRVLNDSRHGLLYGDQMMRGLVENRYACVFWHVSGLHWFDLTGQGAPRYSGDNFPGRIGAANGLVAHQGKTLATLRGGYLLLDRDERRPLAELPVRRVGSRGQHIGKPSIFGDRLYAANRSTGEVIIADISDVETPQLIEQFNTGGHPGRVQIHQGRIVIPNGYHGLLVE